MDTPQRGRTKRNPLRVFIVSQRDRRSLPLTKISFDDKMLRIFPRIGPRQLLIQEKRIPRRLVPLSVRYTKHTVLTGFLKPFAVTVPRKDPKGRDQTVAKGRNGSTYDITPTDIKTRVSFHGEASLDTVHKTHPRHRALAARCATSRARLTVSAPSTGFPREFISIPAEPPPDRGTAPPVCIPN